MHSPNPPLHTLTQQQASKALLQRSTLLLVAYYVPYILVHSGMAKLQMVRACVLACTRVSSV